MAKAKSKAAVTEPVAAKQVKPTSKATEIAKKLGVDVLYENSKGEYFTDLNRAYLSDKKENIKEYRFNVEPAPEPTAVKMEKRILTEEDFKTTPELKEKGFKPGDEIEVPVTE